MAKIPKPKQNIDVGDARRLKDQLSVFRKQQEVHQNARLLREVAFYPAHDPRKETPQYKAVHRKLVVEEDSPCLICGVRNSTLKDNAKNLYGAKQIETHHHVVEWALANAIDVNKFNSQLLPHLRARHKDRKDYQTDFTDDQVKAWIDHDPDNLWVLCDVHHRSSYFGIYEITDPIWGPMNLLRDDFGSYVRDQLLALKGSTKASKTKKR